MKKILIVFVLLLPILALAAVEERTYILNFENSPNAGPAVNVVFSFNIDPSITLVKPQSNLTLVDGVLTIQSPEDIPSGGSWQAIIVLNGPEETLNQFESREIVFDWRDANFSGTGSTVVQRSAEPGFLENLRSNPVLVEQIKEVGVPLAVGLGGVGVISLGTTAVSASASLAYNIAEFFRYIAFGFLRFKKRRPWGMVYNEATNRSIAGVLAKIFDAQNKKLKESQLTDAEGRFGFLVTPGEYYVKVSRRGFEEKQTDLMKITKPDAVSDVNISLSPLTAGVKKLSALAKILNILKKIMNYINPYILALGTILSAFVMIVVPSTLNYVIFAVYAALDILKILLSLRTIKSYGTITDKDEHQPLDLAVVRIFDAEKNWLLNTKVTDDGGRFNFLTVPGSYYLTAARGGYEPFHSKILQVKKAGIVNFDIKLAGER